MAPTAIVTPNVLTDPGYLFIAPVSTSAPTNTVAGSVFTDAWAGAWIPLGATEDGSTFNYTTEVEPVTVAEFLDPIRYATTGRSGSIAFNLANISLSNYRRALNGGTGALTATSGSTTTTYTTTSPPTAGSEVRCMIGWESLDNTMRLVAFQTIQGGEIGSVFGKAPSYTTIPCTFNMEVPSSGIPFALYGAGVARQGS